MKQTIRTTTYKQAVENMYPFMQFVSMGERHMKLEDDEYFALMVIDYDYPRNRSPHVIGIDVYSHVGLVGIEGTSKPQRPYISKNYSSRRDSYRGKTVIVKINEADLEKCCVLNN